MSDYGEGVLIPAFSDLHVHAPQYLNRGLGSDLLLADWLYERTLPRIDGERCVSDVKADGIEYPKKGFRLTLAGFGESKADS